MKERVIWVWINMRVSKWWLHHPWAGYQNDWWSETLHILQQHNHTRSHSESIHKWFSIRSINKCKNNVSNLCPAHVSQGNMSPSLLLPKELPEDGFVGGSWEAHVAPHGQTGEGLPPDAVWRSGRCDWRCLTDLRWTESQSSWSCCPGLCLKVALQAWSSDMWL